MSRTTRAKQLRRKSTDAERILWRRLRGYQLSGNKFRRQHPIGPYVVDFVCLERRVVIEIDGGQHAVKQDQDAKRTAWLEAEGYRVLRFWNDDALINTEGILLSIERALAKG